MIRFRLWLLTVFLAAVELDGAAVAATRNIRFQTDGKSQEQKYLWKHSSRNFVLEGWGKPVRNLDGTDQFVIWRFDVTGVTAARIRIHLLNSYALSVSSNGRDFQEVSRQVASGGSNQGWKAADLTPYLPARYVYVRIEHGAEKQGGYGACIFHVHVELEGESPVAIARAAFLGEVPDIDGQLSEPGWQNAQPLSTLAERFMKRIPKRQTTFRLAWDRDYWYFAVSCEQPAADKAVADGKAIDSAVCTDDCVECFLSPPGRDDYFHLAANLHGTVFDEYKAAGADSWTSNARVATRRTPHGWMLEAAIPVSSMKATMEAGQQWRIELCRVNLESAQYTAWSSVEGGRFHAPHRFGRVTLIEATKVSLPAVNISFSQPTALGKHLATLRYSGSVDPSRHEFSLDVLPIRSSAIPPAQQDLTQMNPIFQTIDWQENDSGSTWKPESTQNKSPAPAVRDSVKTEFTLDRFGAAHIIATLRERESGGIISRSIQSVTVSREQAEPINLTLQQPFVSTESTLPAEVRLNIQEEKLHGANVEATLTDQAGKSIHSTNTEAVTTPVQLVFPVDELLPGQYRILIDVAGKTGQSLAKSERTFTKYIAPGQPRSVTINQRGVCLVDGKPMMPLGFMLGGATPEAVSAGYNVGLWGCEYPNDPADRAGTDRALANGGMAILHVCNYLRGKDDIEGLRARVSRLKNEPGLLAWYLADEPEGHGDTPELLRSAYRAIREIDPRHPVYICTNAPGMLSRYKGCADIIGADPYPIPGHDLTMVADWTDAAVAAARQNGQAVWMTPQGFGWKDLGSPRGRSPTNDEFTCMLATCFIHGAKGIVWWPYSVPRQKYWKHFHWMGRASRSIEPWILHGGNVDGMPVGVQRTSGVHWRVWQHNGRALLLASNLSKEPKSLPLRIPNRFRTYTLPAPGVGSKSDNKSPPRERPTDGRLKINLKPTQTVIAVLSSKET
jgi:hypothetical protein